MTGGLVATWARASGTPGAIAKMDFSVLSDAELEDAVLQYVAEHPQAMDTLVGIAEWWIMRRQVRVDVEALQRVLERLIQKGLLEKSESGEQTRYHLKLTRN
jgi:hypothetical protein